MMHLTQTEILDNMPFNLAAPPEQKVIQTYNRPHTTDLPKTPKLNTPSCEDGGREFSLTLSERRHEQLHCGSCGTRFNSRGGATKMVLPKHNIPVAVHEYRKNLERNGIKD